MQIDDQTIDRIVAGVLKQLSADGSGVSAGGSTATRRHGGAVSREASPSAAGSGSITLTANVITADVLLNGMSGASQVVVPKRAIVTPAAWDVAKERRIEISRGEGVDAVHVKSAAIRDGRQANIDVPLTIIVQHTEAVGRLIDDLNGHWRRELVSCPDDAAALAISVICRGDAATVVVFAEQTHRAACRANRNERVKAAAVRDAGDVRAVQSQLRANVWCIDPTNRSWFELRQLHRAISGRT